MPAVSTVYVAFFLASLSLLFLICCLKTPEMWRSWRRFLRQMVARKTREERMLADLEKLMAEARRLEGIYCFESIESHHSPAICGETQASPSGSSVEAPVSALSMAG